MAQMCSALQMTAKMPSEAIIQVMPVTTAKSSPNDCGGIGAALHAAQTASEGDDHAEEGTLKIPSRKPARLIDSTVRAR